MFLFSLKSVYESEAFLEMLFYTRSALDNIPPD